MEPAGTISTEVAAPVPELEYPSPKPAATSAPFLLATTLRAAASVTVLLLTTDIKSRFMSL